MDRTSALTSLWIRVYAIEGWGTTMRLRYRLICTPTVCCIVCVSYILAAAAQSPAPSSVDWTLCASREVRLAAQAIAACTAIIASSDADSDAAAAAYGYRGLALRRSAR